MNAALSLPMRGKSFSPRVRHSDARSYDLCDSAFRKAANCSSSVKVSVLTSEGVVEKNLDATVDDFQVPL